MRFWHLGVLAALAAGGSLVATNAYGQTGTSRAASWLGDADKSVVQTGAISRAAYRQDGRSPFVPEDKLPAPSDPGYPPPPKGAGSAMADAGSLDAALGVNSGCGACSAPTCDPTCGEPDCGGKKCGWCCRGSLGEPWTLPVCGPLKERDIKLGGWLSGGAFFNTYGDTSNGPLGFRNLATGSSDQNYFFAEKKVNTSKSVFDWGFRADYIFGIDAPKMQAFGDQSWDYGWNSSRDYGSAIPQAYAEVGWNDLSIKGGHFITPMGYETAQAVGRFFYSTSYLLYYAEPFTHTGALGTYKVTDKFSASVGWTDGWDNGFANNNGASTILGGVNWTPGKKFNLAWYFNTGRFGNGQYGGNNGEIFLSTLVATVNLSDRLSYVFQNDYAVNYGLPTADTQWYGISQYLLYKMNDCWSMGGRFEWFRDDDGVRVTSDGFGRVLGNPGDYCEVSLGLNYKPHTNILVRPEIRYDWFNGTVANGHSLPFNRGQSSDQVSGGFDMIFTF